MNGKTIGLLSATALLFAAPFAAAEDSDTLADAVVASLTELAGRGLRSVIVIGGGEPTVDPNFEVLIRHMKSLGLKVGVVTNGSMLDKILAVADVLEPEDWVRLSLDSGTNETFVAMHKPRKKHVTLDWICGQVAPTMKLGSSPHRTRAWQSIAAVVLLPCVPAMEIPVCRACTRPSASG